MKAKEPASRAAVIFCALVIAVTGLMSLYEWKESQRDLKPHIKAEINMGKYDPHNQKLLSGYNYYLLSHISEDTPTRIDITISDNLEQSLDSLVTGSLDILAIPFDDSLAVDSTIIRLQIDSAGLWLLSPDMDVEAEVIEKWVSDYQESESYERRRMPFFNLYDPFRKASADFISPYDSIIKVYADTLDWDWRLLAAVVYQESNFRIEANSSRGAKGLMQMVSSTARHFGVTDLTDPEQSIRAGALYLRKLSRRYQSIPAGERKKFVLAAYNAGEGRIKDCRNFARYRGASDEEWDSIVELIPEMNDSSILNVDAVKLGIFKGQETISYVNNVLSLWDEYKRICQ